MLSGARQPVVLAGHGAARAGAAGALRRFSEQLGLPVATTFHGKGVFPGDHPHALATACRTNLTGSPERFPIGAADPHRRSRPPPA